MSDFEYDSGREAKSTNNVMELRAVIEALKAQPRDQFVQIVSDSKYVTDCFNQRWYVGWCKKGWKNSKGEAVKNREVWQELLDVVDSRTANTRWVYVKGHSGDPGNEKADALAVAARLGSPASASPFAAEVEDDGSTLTARHARSLLERATRERGADYVYKAPADAEGFVYFDSRGKPSCLIGHVLSYLDLGPGGVPEGSNVWLGLRDLIPAEAGVMEGLDSAQACQDEGNPWGEALDAFDNGIALALADAA